MPRNLFSIAVVLLLSIQVVHAQSPASEPSPVWRQLTSGVKSSLRGLCVVDAETLWVSGADNTVLRSVDGGESFENVSPQLDEQLDFRDIHAFDSSRAVILSAGQPARVYVTDDGGKNWNLAFEHPDPRAFFDALSFWDQDHGIAMSDPIDGRVLLIQTTDGGKTWLELSADRRPKSRQGEAGFAASGTNMRVAGSSVIHIALGGAPAGEVQPTSRIVSSFDGAMSWTNSVVPVPRSESAGIFSLAFDSGGNGVAVGGDYKQPNLRAGNVAVTKDAKSWSKPNGTPPSGFRSGVAVRERGDERVWVTVGTNGTDVSTDGGHNWKQASGVGFHAIQFVGQVGFASGADGRIAKWVAD
ncbi:MAG: YCF48-related protein [Planctomycetota bacterium]